MKNLTTQILATSFTLLFTFAFSASAQVTVTEKNVQSGGQSSTFSYSIQNNGSSPILDFVMNAGVPVTDMMAPTGWTSSTVQLGDNDTISWSSSDPVYDLLPNAKLDGFSFKSISGIGSVDYFVDDENLDNFGGSVDGPVPTAVPEASTLVSLGVGLLFLTGILLFARKRKKESAQQVG